MAQHESLGTSGVPPLCAIKIDRIDCPWLIRRFIDPRAEFPYAPSAQLLAMLDHGMVVYDALCAWIRAARAEVNNADLFRHKAGIVPVILACGAAGFAYTLLL